MEFDLKALPSLMTILLGLWTVVLLTYRILKALIESKKTADPLAGLLHDVEDDGPTECVYRTGEYFLKSSGPCLCTGVISGVVTHISERDRVKLFHETPGYPHLEDTLHVRLTGLKTAQNQGKDTRETKSFETIVKVGDTTRSVETDTVDHPGETLFLSYNGGNATLTDSIHGNPHNDNYYFDERMLGFNAFNINKAHNLEDARIGIPNQNDPNQTLLVKDPPNNSGQPISIISEMKPTVVPGNGVVVPTYGKLNKRYNQELSGFEICKKNISSSPKDPHFLVPHLSNDSNISQVVEEPPSLIGNAGIARDNGPATKKVIQNQIPGTPNPAISLPAVHLSISDNVVLAPGADPECPLFDIILHEAENRVLEGRNPMMEEYLMYISGRATAYRSVGPMSNVSPYTTLLIDVCQQVRTSEADDNPMQIHGEQTAEQLSKFLHGPAVSISTVFGSDPMTKSIVPSGNGRALPEASLRNIHWELPWTENSLKNQIICSEGFQSKTPNPDDINDFSEDPIILLGNSNHSQNTCFKVLSSDPVIEFEYVQAAMKSNERSSGNAALQLNHSLNLDDWKTTSDYEAVNTEARTTTMIPTPLCTPPVPWPPSPVQSSSCGGGTVTIAADERNSMGGDDSPDSAPAKLSMVTSGPVTVDLDGESSSRTGNADDKNFISEEMSYTCGPRMLTFFSPNNGAIDCNREALRSIIISRRKSAVSSGSSISSTSEDCPFTFSPLSPGHYGLHSSGSEDLPRTNPICSCHGLISGRAAHITDGDTIRLLHTCLDHPESNDTQVRLAGIDAPEFSDQPFSEEAKEHLTDLIHI